MDGNDMPLWKLVLGVALGVTIGVLAADAVRLWMLGQAVETVVRQWDDAAFDEPPSPGATPEQSPARASEPRKAPSLPVLEGSGTARAKGIDRACINGTIVDRSGNGWEQDLRNGRPRPCRARSP